MSVLDLFDLSGQTAIVTGGGSGIGRDLAVALAEAGANLVIPDISGSVAEEGAAAVRAVGREALALEVDVADQAAVERCFAATLDRFGRLDVLVNNAGGGRQAPTVSLSAEDWQRVFDVNVHGIFYCCQLAGRLMIEQRRGKIINIASVYGLVGTDERLYIRDDGQPHQSLAYNSSKGAVVNLTRALAVQWAPHGVNVNAIAPGMIRTKRLATRISPQTWENLVERTPMRRWGTGEDLTGAALYLASRASDFVTGHILVVDGGWTAW